MRNHINNIIIDVKNINIQRTGRGWRAGRHGIRQRFPCQATGAKNMIVKDSNGTPLQDGDSVTLIKDLKVKGTSVTLERGTLIKNIRQRMKSNAYDARHEKTERRGIQGIHVFGTRVQMWHRYRDFPQKVVTSH
ncbi:PhnA protein (plasmid) [Rhizobium gallicum]|uniref:PhnA protein n=3 Tax=Rhizobium TaxID=379 RepID=A0A1L5NRI7_9HYPH|nr:PhnA protein [Rhizobium gallicum]